MINDTIFLVQIMFLLHFLDLLYTDHTFSHIFDHILCIWALNWVKLDIFSVFKGIFKKFSDQIGSNGSKNVKIFPPKMFCCV